jgi:hypothetical protein
VAVVTDACGAWSAAAAAQSMRQMDAKGAILVTTDELISGGADERIRDSRPDFVPDEDEPAANDDPLQIHATVAMETAVDSAESRRRLLSSLQNI